MIAKRYLTRILLTSACATSVMAVMAQEQKSTLALADAHYNRYEYKQAAVYYEEVSGKKNVKTETLRKLADCYRQVNDYGEAAGWYGKIAQLDDRKADDILFYADALKSSGNYDQAKEVYARYRQESGKDVSRQVAGCDSAIKWKAEAPSWQIRNMRELNTAASEWGATWYRGTQLVFTSDSLRTTMLDIPRKSSGGNYLKLYQVDTVGSNPDGTIIRGFETTMNRYRYHAGPVVFSVTGDTAYLTLTNAGKGAYNGRKSFFTRRLELYYSVRKNNGWQRPQPFPYNAPASYSLGHAAIAGNILYFASDMPGGQGKTDIWFCEIQADGSWSKPQNCGPVINTDDEDAFPTVNEDGQLYFSSKGHVGMGGFDLFTAVGSASTWNTPVNLRAGINSAGDDFYFVKQVAGKGIFASNREGGIGNDDLYTFSIPVPATPLAHGTKPVITLEALLRDKETGQPLTGVAVTLKDLDRDEMWTELSTGGKLHMVLTEGHHYVLYASGGGRGMAVPIKFTAGANDVVSLTVNLPKAPPLVGGSFQLKNILYDRDDYHIRPDAVASLDSLVYLMDRYPDMQVELAAHTDSRADEKYNVLLSERRAVSATEYLIKKGIKPHRITARGYGETYLLNRCSNGVECTEEEHQQNRRTEVKVLKR